MIKKLGKIIIATVLIVFVLGNPLYAKDRGVLVLDDQTGQPISNANVLLIVSKREFNPVDMTHLWRRVIHKKTDQQGCFTAQDSDFIHPSRFGRASDVTVYICKTGYWPSSDTLQASMIYISFLKPSDLKREHRLKKVTNEEYLSEKYYWAIRRCPESEEKKLFFDKTLPAKVKRFKKNIFTDNPDMIINALREMKGSSMMKIGGTLTDEILMATGKILAHENPAVRRAACRFFSDYPTPTLTGEIMKSLLSLLKDSYPDVQEAAGEAIATHGKEAVSYFKSSILNLLSCPEPTLQKVAVQTISKYSEYQRGGRYRKGGDPDIISPLRKLLHQTSDEEWIKTLLYTLGNLGYPEYFQDLESFYTHPNPQIQWSVITSMRLETPFSERKKALPYFIQSLQSLDSNVRYAAVTGIVRFGDKTHINCLKELLKTEKRPSLRDYTEKAISRLEKKKGT
ncbi:MAG: HEAT repeat domain-containing protein [Thermodesulfobacteriota bacterium]|nr:HEAT repeat domain-containing protein [Thermodesulfobacteriota bacterium]